MSQDELNSQVDSLNRVIAERTEALENELRKHAETRSDLYNEKQRAQITLNAISDSVITTDIDGVIRFMNPAAYKMLDNKKSFSPFFFRCLSSVEYRIQRSSNRSCHLVSRV